MHRPCRWGEVGLVGGLGVWGFGFALVELKKRYVGFHAVVISVAFWWFDNVLQRFGLLDIFGWGMFNWKGFLRNGFGTNFQ